MKIEIEMKLETENWLTPGEILTWRKKEFPIDKYLSYSQINDICAGLKGKKIYN